MDTFKKWFIRIVLAAAALFLLLGIIAWIAKPGVPPETEWAVQTYTNDEFRIPSRYYYGDKIDYLNGYPVLLDYWWDYDGKHYRKHRGDKPFPVNDYGIVDVIRRNVK